MTTTNQIYFHVHRDAISISRYPCVFAVEMVCAKSALAIAGKPACCNSKDAALQLIKRLLLVAYLQVNVVGI